MVNYMKERIRNKVVIFLGMPRSGTTLVSEYLSMHGDCAWITNYHNRFPRSYLLNLVVPLSINRWWNVAGIKNQQATVSLLDRIRVSPSEAYDFWNSILGDEVRFSTGIHFGEIPHKKIEELNNRFRFIRKLQFKNNLVFKLTGPSRISLLKSIFPEALYILVTRNDFACISSLLKVDFWKASRLVTPWWDIPMTDDIATTYREFSFLEKTAFNYYYVSNWNKNELQTVDHLEVNYEYFLNNHQNVMHQYRSFTKIEPDIVNIKRYINKNPIRSLVNIRSDSELFSNDDIDLILDVKALVDTICPVL